VRRYSTSAKQFSQALLHIFVIQLPGNFHRQAFSAELIDHVQDPERSAILGALHDEIVAPDVAGKLRFQPQAGAVVEPQPAALGLLGRSFQAFLLLVGRSCPNYSMPRKRGSSASRSPSPIRLNAATVSRMASPGNSDSQGCVTI
jgi:hypothetical protein